MSNYQKEEKAVLRAGEAYEWIESAILAFVVILLVFTFVARNATVIGASMEPTLHEGDRLVLQQMGYDDPQYGDIVVVDRSQSDGKPFIKRVIGRPGDVIYIDFDKGEVWRNNELLDEPYINELTMTSFDVEYPATVPENHLFVMGDNRNHSSDSRVREIGMVDYRLIAGKAIFRFAPLRKMGGLQ